MVCSFTSSYFSFYDDKYNHHHVLHDTTTNNILDFLKKLIFHNINKTSLGLNLMKHKSQKRSIVLNVLLFPNKDLVKISRFWTIQHNDWKSKEQHYYSNEVFKAYCEWAKSKRDFNIQRKIKG